MKFHVRKRGAPSLDAHLQASVGCSMRPRFPSATSYAAMHGHSWSKLADTSQCYLICIGCCALLPSRGVVSFMCRCWPIGVH